MLELLQPLSPDQIALLSDLDDVQVGKRLILHSGEFPDLDDIDIAIIGIEEDRGDPENEGCKKGANAIRPYLYQLYQGDYDLKVADLGNILPGAVLTDTYAALKQVVQELLEMNIVSLIIGGCHDLTYGQYLGYESRDKLTNLLVVDERIDLGEEGQLVNANGFLHPIFVHQPNFLFDFTQIGYQSYFVPPKTIQTLEKLRFDCHRLGHIRSNMEEVEPIVRDADLISFDLCAIRQSDAPGHGKASPHGFYGEEACQIARYAGLSDKLTSMGFYGYNPFHDYNHQTAQLLAQMVWYFLEGYYNRKQDFPIRQETDYLKYIVDYEDNDYELVFRKSLKSDRWWIEVPNFKNGELAKQYFVPCSYSDYQSACQGDVPEKWLRAYEKLN